VAREVSSSLVDHICLKVNDEETQRSDTLKNGKKTVIKDKINELIPYTIVNNSKINTSISSSENEIEIWDEEKLSHQEHEALKELKGLIQEE